MKRGLLIGLALLLTLATPVAADPADRSNVAPCEKAIIGHGSADWRSESVVAGPVGVRRHPLSSMSRTRNGLVTKMPLLAEGRAPETVTVSVPPALRRRVFLYYGRVLGRHGQPTTSFHAARGYGETVFQLCGNKPRTIWPGGVRIKGAGPVHLKVRVDGLGEALQLPLGRPHESRPVALAGRG
jgi:hypothetical protein